MDNSPLFKIHGFEGQWICLAILPDPDGDNRRIMMLPGNNKVMVVKVDNNDTLHRMAGPFTTEEIEDTARDALFGRFFLHQETIQVATGYFMSQVALKQGLDLTD